jgi:hypothetical protein
MTDYLPLLLGIIGVVLLVNIILIIYMGRYIATLKIPKSGGLFMIGIIVIMITYLSGSIVLLSKPDVVLTTVGMALILFASLVSYIILIVIGTIINK